MNKRAGGTPALPEGTITSAHKEWYSRGYLPHFDHAEIVQMINFRLADSLPSHLLEQLEQTVDNIDDAMRRKRIETFLDAGNGSCALRDPRIGKMVEEALFHFDGKRYRLLAWVLMPNHIHVLVEFEPEFPLHRILHGWKSYTAKEANKILEKSGPFWAKEYFDRFIRDSRHFENAMRYIHENPVRAGLVAKAEDWEFSSAYGVRRYPGSAGILPAHYEK